MPAQHAPQSPDIDFTNVLWCSTQTKYTHLASFGDLQAFPINSSSPPSIITLSRGQPLFSIKIEQKAKGQNPLQCSFFFIINIVGMIRMKYSQL